MRLGNRTPLEIQMAQAVRKAREQRELVLESFQMALDPDEETLQQLSHRLEAVEGHSAQSRRILADELLSLLEDFVAGARQG